MKKQPYYKQQWFLVTAALAVFVVLVVGITSSGSQYQASLNLHGVTNYKIPVGGPIQTLGGSLSAEPAPTLAQCKQLKLWAAQGTLTANLKGNMAEWYQCKQLYSSYVNTWPTLAQCQQLNQYSQQATLSPMVAQGKVDYADVVYCSNQYSALWSSNWQPTKAVCQLLGGWYAQGVLTSELNGNSGMWTLVQQCSNAFPDYWVQFNLTAPNGVLTNYPRVATIQWNTYAQYLPNVKSFDIEITCDYCVSVQNPWSGATIYNMPKPANANGYYSYVTKPLPGDNQYRVRVRAKNQDNTTTGWSQSLYFSYKTKK